MEDFQAEELAPFPMLEDIEVAACSSGDPQCEANNKLRLFGYQAPLVKHGLLLF